jgi:FkbM family methyltransferase
MGIGRLLPEFIKYPIREFLRIQGLPFVFHHARVDPLFFAYRQRGILNHGTDYISGEGFLIQSVLPRILAKEGQVLFDVGANVGNYSKVLYSIFPDAQILAFEPMPSTFKALRESLANTKVNCQSLALSEAEGTATIYDYDQTDGSEHASLFLGVFEELHKAKNTRKTQVSLSTLDFFCRDHGIQRIDFLKIDTEGNELKVLQGAKSMLQSNSIHSIQFEFNEMNVVARVFLKDFYEILKGFSFFRLLPGGLLPLGRYSSRNEIFGSQNIFAINNSTIAENLMAPFIAFSAPIEVAARLKDPTAQPVISPE